MLNPTRLANSLAFFRPARLTLSLRRRPTGKVTTTLAGSATLRAAFRGARKRKGLLEALPFVGFLIANEQKTQVRSD